MFIVIAKLSEGRRRTREEKKKNRLSDRVEMGLNSWRIVYNVSGLFVERKKPGEVGLRLVLRLESLKELGLISCGGGGKKKLEN